jgi:peptidoglycan hydrolase CwlO-like protein
MKNIKYYLGILGLTLTIAGCGPDYKAEVEKMMHERDSLMAQYDAKDSVINGYMQDITEIQSNVESLTRQEEIINRTSANSAETSTDAKTKVLNDIEAIRQLIDQNKKKLSELQSRIRKNNVKIGELEKLITSLNNQLAQKDSSINTLNEKVLSLNGTITNMQGQIDTIKNESLAKSKEITDKVNKLNTAYYTVGSYKVLRDKKVISKQGGFLGLGKQKSFIPDFNQDAFTQIDVTNTKTIDLTAKDAHLISTHPNGTYQIKRDKDKVTGIEITDPEKFWKASKYLVVVTE